MGRIPSAQACPKPLVIGGTWALAQAMQL